MIQGFHFQHLPRARQRAISGCAVAALLACTAAGASTISISGTPATSATAGTAYSFTPRTTEPVGERPSFSVKNKPAWASFSIATGTISGTPTAANVGTYSDIVISMNAGTADASLAAFSIAVKASGAGSVTVDWSAPTRNTNGSALTDLAGYRVHYGKSPSSMTTSVDVANAGATSYTVGSLASGTWYFAVSDYTTSGAQSADSSIVSKPVP